MSWFKDILGWIWCLIQKSFYFVVNNIFELLDIVAQLVLIILPNSPFIFEPIEWGIFGNIIGFFIPIAKILNHFLIILSAIAIYYAVRYLLRLVKQVQ